MTTMISLSLVNACVFASMALLCGAIFAGMRRQPAVAWLALGLLCASVSTLVMALWPVSVLSVMAPSLLVPLAFLCIGQSVRMVTGGAAASRPLIGAIVGLTALSLVLLAGEAPFIVQTLPFHLACGLALGECVVRLYRDSERGVLNFCLMAVLIAHSSVFLLRVPLFSLLFPIDAPYELIRASWLERSLLILSGLLTPPGVFLLLAKIILGVVSAYRTRSERDGLTGLLNRRAFDEAADRKNGAGAVIFCDLDHFKAINDAYGHQVGDAVLRAFAGMVEGTGLPAGRIGGEEFALLLPGKRANEAAGIAEMIRVRFNETSHPGVTPGHSISASFGVAEHSPQETAAKAFGRADRALYRAKAAGGTGSWCIPATI